MPEGPEVRRQTTMLQVLCTGAAIIDMSILGGRYIRQDQADTSGLSFFQRKCPHHVITVDCKGKFIYFEMEDGNCLFSTLGMSGYWSEKPDIYSRIKFRLHTDDLLYYNDQRNFGTFKWTNHEALEKKLASLGPDPLQDNLYLSDFKERLIAKDRTMAETLMDQSVFSGIGNYLKAEILWCAQISPHRKTSDLTDKEIEVLHRIIPSVMIESYGAGRGSSLTTFRRLHEDFDLTYPEDRMLAVYSQLVDPLGNEITSEETKDKRKTWWVPKVQK